MAIKTLEQFTTEAQTEIDALKVANGGSGLKISVMVQLENIQMQSMTKL